MRTLREKMESLLDEGTSREQLKQKAIEAGSAAMWKAMATTAPKGSAFKSLVHTIDMKLGKDLDDFMDGLAGDDALQEAALNRFAENLLLNEATPSLVKHCVRAVSERYNGDTHRAFAICVASMQKAGYIEKGSMNLTAAGKAKSSAHSQESDAGKKTKDFEKMIQAASPHGESVEPECLTCEAKDAPCPECKESGGLVYEDACDCWTCEACGWKGSNAKAEEAKRDSFEFKSEDGKYFEIRWSAKRNRFIVTVTDEDWDYEDEADARDMSSEIRNAKSVEDAIEILGVSESVDEAKKPTFAQKHDEFMAGLEKEGWKLKTRGPNFKPLKVPHATSPDGQHKLWFKTQAVYLSRADQDFGAARTLSYDDMRGHDFASFSKLVARRTGAEPTVKAAAPSAQNLTPDQYHQKHGQCPDGHHFDSATKRCVKTKAESVEMRRLMGLDIYPDRKLEAGSSKLMDRREREAAGVAGAHEDWSLDAAGSRGDGGSPSHEEEKEVFQCMECGKKFKTVKAAEKAQQDGCPKCGGSDIDLAAS